MWSDEGNFSLLLLFFGLLLLPEVNTVSGTSLSPNVLCWYLAGGEFLMVIFSKTVTQTCILYNIQLFCILQAGFKMICQI